VTTAASLLALVGLVAPAPASADDHPKVLFVAHGTVPYPLREAIPRVLSARAELLSTTAYHARCQRAGVQPYSTRALTRIAPRFGADVIAVATWVSWGRSRVIRMTYRDGRTGRVLGQGRHTLPGVRLDREARRGIVRELVTTAGLAGRGAERGPERVARAPAERTHPAPTRAPEEPDEEEAEEIADESSDEDGGGLPPPVDWSEDGEDAAGAAAASTEDEAEEAAVDEAVDDDVATPARTHGFGFQATAGFGFGARSAAVPMEAGPARLSTSPFPAAALGLGAGYDTGSVGLFVRARYFTSVGLRTKDIRSDGTTRTVDARSQSLALALAVELALSDAESPTLLDLSIGYQFRLFHAEIPVSMPEYTLSGVYVRADLSFPVGSGPLRLAVAPEVGAVNAITEQLQDVGQVSAGISVGAEAAVRVQLLDQLQVEVVYRESHAFIASERDTDMTDVERFGVLRATYAP
jgi:hypothetical protein